MIVEIPIKRVWEQQAEKDAKEMGQLKGSITRGEGNKAGFIGEIVGCGVCQGKRCNTFQHDFLLPNGQKVEVKTKRCSGKPKLHYNCSVCLDNPNQTCDYYLFIRVNYEFTTCWVLGYLPKEEFMKLAFILEDGELDLVDNARGFVAKRDCLNVTIEQLRDIKELRYGN